MRYFLYLSYKGTNYHGWQVQKNALGVQAVVNQSLETILRGPVVTVGSGRTDAGVHAIEQVLHFDSDQELDPIDFVYKLNSLLPMDIAATGMRKVFNEAHARFSATERKYIYCITSVKNPFTQGLAYYFRKELDLETMNNLSGFILNQNDFESFSKVKTDVNNFICDIRHLLWERNEDRIHFTVSANRFLRGMVRALVGTMIEVGLGNISPDKFEKIVASKKRSEAGTSVPAQGLFLSAISYPDDIFKRSEEE